MSKSGVNALECHIFRALPCVYDELQVLVLRRCPTSRLFRDGLDASVVVEYFSGLAVTTVV